jgi:transcriptional regulator with XRE-family HTH domain
MEYDYSKLKGRVVECFGTQEAFSREIGMSPAGLSAKLRNLTGFTQDEICAACLALNIPARQISQYFFTHKVQKN